MNLFDETERYEQGHKLATDSEYGYLNRSARLEAKRIRNVLQEWFSHYAKEHCNSLRGNLRSFNDYNHLSAFFELFLHELLICMPCDLEIHPKLAHTSRRPDFLVKQDNGSAFYLEAKVVMNESKEEAGQRARVARITDKVNQSVKSDRVFLSIYPKKISRRAARTSKMTKWLQEKVESLDYTELLDIVHSKDYGRIPKWEWSDDDWLIEFEPIPKSPDKISGTVDRIIGIGPIEVKLDKTEYSLRSALINKAKRYGRLNKPYVIAANVRSPTADNEDIENALFGDEIINEREIRAGQYSKELTRKWNGVWTSEKGPRYTRNSAILICKGLDPWRISYAPVCLFHHPSAKRPYNSALTRLPQWKLKDGNRHLVEGESLGKILDLPAGWPE